MEVPYKKPRGTVEYIESYYSATDSEEIIIMGDEENEEENEEDITHTDDYTKTVAYSDQTRNQFAANSHEQFEHPYIIQDESQHSIKSNNGGSAQGSNHGSAQDSHGSGNGWGSNNNSSVMAANGSNSGSGNGSGSTGTLLNGGKGSGSGSGSGSTQKTKSTDNTSSNHKSSGTSKQTNYSALTSTSRGHSSHKTDTSTANSLLSNTQSSNFIMTHSAVVDRVEDINFFTEPLMTGYITDIEHTEVEDDDYDQFGDQTDSDNFYNEDCDQSGSSQHLNFTLLGHANVTEMDERELIHLYTKDREFNSVESREPLTNDNVHKIRVFSWNILADGDSYSMSDRHDYTPINFRRWEYRSARIYASICAYNPDMITLQEVTGKMYHSFIKPKFENIGYATLHIAKDRDTMQSDTILYRKIRFQLCKSETVHLGSISHQFGANYFGPSNNMFRNFLKSKNNLAFLTLFQDRTTNKHFVVLSGHLFWSPDRPHIKSAQMFILNQYLIHLLTTHLEWRVPNIDYTQTATEIMAQIPIIFTCDANSVPWKVACLGQDLITNSGVSEIMDKSELSSSHVDHPVSQYEMRYHRSVGPGDTSEYNPQIVLQQIEALRCIKPWQLSVPISWRSVYAAFNESKFPQSNHNACYEPVFTNKVPEFCDTIDYIFINDRVHLLSVLRMPYEKEYSKLLGADVMGLRYLKERQHKFGEYIRNFHESCEQILISRERYFDQLLFTGFVRTHMGGSTVDTTPSDNKIITTFLSYYISSFEYENMLRVHDEYLFRQSYWRMLYSSLYGKSKFDQDDVQFNAFNYPFMPNRKDPSDHLALCCDVEIK